MAKVRQNDSWTAAAGPDAMDQHFPIPPATIDELTSLTNLGSETSIGIQQGQGQIGEFLVEVARQLRGTVNDVGDAFTLQRLQIRRASSMSPRNNDGITCHMPAYLPRPNIAGDLPLA